MPRRAPEDVTRVAVVGTGLIGGGWAAHFLRRGYQVAAWDPAPDAEARLNSILDAAWPALEALGFQPGASRDNLRFAPSLADAVGNAEFVQESAPDDRALKERLFGEIDAAAPTETPIASSTSGILMSTMDGLARHPERLLVGHPFLPNYILPLVEVVGSPRTDPAVVDWVTRFYEHGGKTVLRMGREVPGFVADRLQTAIQREMMHMLANGEATVTQLDLAVTGGPGLRWAFLGPLATFFLGSGPAGLDWLPDGYDDAFRSDWSRLDGPELTPEMEAHLHAAYAELRGGRTVEEVMRWRDETLLAILAALGTPMPGRSGAQAARPAEPVAAGAG